jgi:hypothetical protein
MPAPESYQSLGGAVTQLTRVFQIERGLVRALGGWMAGVPYWDAKLVFGDHLWAYAQSATELLKRLHELKETATEHQECAPVAALLRDLVPVRDGDDFLWGGHGTLWQQLAALFTEWANRIDPTMDPLSGRILREAAGRLQAQADWFAVY